tara:strand:+ start:75 stop:1289 length:1215 start_codon:yes stop_codon:yes gene_type:complete
MAIKTFDSNRVGGGTFQIEQDAATGEFKVKEVGFIKLPELKLPELSSAQLPAIPTPEVPTPDIPSVADPFKQPDQRGDDNRDQNINYQNYMRNLQREATGQEKVDTKVEDKAKQFSASDIAYKNYEDTQKKYQDAIAANAPSRELRQLSLDVDKARNAIGNVPEQNVMLQDAAGNIERPVDPIKGIGRSQSAKFKERFDPTKIQAAPPRKNAIEKAEELFRNSASVNFIGRALKTGATILENIAGMTDEQRALNNTNRTALKSIGYLTKAELGSSIDPGRIVKFDPVTGRQLSAADNVFVGMNRESLRGNVFEGAQSRIDTRNSKKTQDRISKLSPEKQKAFNDKTKEYERQLKEAEDERDNKQDKSPPKDDKGPVSTGSGGSPAQQQATRSKDLQSMRGPIGR